MKSGEKGWKQKLSRWLDEWKLAGSGIILASRERRFIIALLLTFVIFGTLMSLFSSSTAALGLFWTANCSGKLRILSDGFLALFGVGRSFWDWVLIFSVSILQSILIGLVVLVWQKRKASQSLAQNVAREASNADNLQNAGIAAGLAVLGTGCPTCGTTLLTPLIGTIFSTSSYALAGAVSGILTIAAIVVALLTMKRLGNEAYVLIISERYQKRHQPKDRQEKKEKNHE